MAEQKITLIIDEEGAVSAKTEGFKGNTCLEALDEILEAQTVTTIRTTDEYKQQVTVTRKTTVKQGS